LSELNRAMGEVKTEVKDQDILRLQSPELKALAKGGQLAAAGHSGSAGKVVSQPVWLEAKGRGPNRRFCD
jgi:hypothetical protein